MKIWNYFEKYFLPRKKEKLKILEKYARILGKWKNLEKFGKKCKKFGKSLKSWKFGIILKNIFERGKMKSGKFLKNMLEFGESGKIS